ncbi:hypothetical protein ACEU6E_07185 [Halorutilales archaeon Cl-col2-1]
MTFSDVWYTLLEELEDFSEDTTITTPITNKKLSNVTTSMK